MKRIARALVAVVVMGAALVAGEQAAEAYSTTPSDTYQFCVSGLHASSALSPISERCYDNFTSQQADVNQFPEHPVTLWKDAHGTGWRLALVTANWCAGLTSYLPQMPTGWNDIVSSFTMFDTTCSLAPIYRDISYGTRIYDCGETSGNLNQAPGCSAFPSGVNDQMSSLILSS